MSRFEGWSLTGWIAAAMIAMACAILLLLGWNDPAVRVIVRATARGSVILFLTAFTASSLNRIWPSSAASWLLRNRRFIGVGFAVTHFVHLGALITLGIYFPEPFRADLDTLTLVAGGLGYFFIAAMALTSSDRAVRLLGARRWRLLHKIGVYYIWLIFSNNFIPTALSNPLYIPFALALIAALLLRPLATLYGSRLANHRT